MIRRCISCETIIDPQMPDYCIRCTGCYRKHKRGPTPVPAPVLPPQGDLLALCEPHRAAPFQSPRHFAEWLLEADARAVAAERKVEQLSDEIAGLRDLVSGAALTTGKAARLLEICSRPALDDETGIDSVRNWLRSAKETADRHKAGGLANGD
jgi:hypothetical protein